MLVIPTAAEMIKHSGLPHFIADLKNLFVAFVRVQVCPQMACLGRCIISNHFGCIYLAFPHYVLKNTEHQYIIDALALSTQSDYTI